jgi:hypothetical protein
MQPDGEYIRRHPAAGEARRGAQQVFIERSSHHPQGGDEHHRPDREQGADAILADHELPVPPAA